MYTVLVVCCHPDDMEDSCAGTLLKCKERGDRVVVCYLCSGSMGHEVIMPEELIKIRAAEAAESSAIGGFEVMWGGFHDLDIYADNKEARDKVVDIIRSVNPDFIITNSPDDYMPDHNATSRLVFDACFSATVPHYQTAVPGVAKLTPIYYMDTTGNMGFVPTEYVDITPYIETKLDMIRCHKSQVEWLKDHDNIDFPEISRINSAYRGIQCGVEYAEAFRQCMVYLKGTTKRYLP